MQASRVLGDFVKKYIKNTKTDEKQGAIALTKKGNIDMMKGVQYRKDYL